MPRVFSSSNKATKREYGWPPPLASAGLQASATRARRTTSPSIPMWFIVPIVIALQGRSPAMSPASCLLFPVQSGLTEGMHQTISSVTPAAVAADAPDRGDTSATLRHHPLTSQVIPDVIDLASWGRHQHGDIARDPACVRPTSWPDPAQQRRSVVLTLR